MEQVAERVAHTKEQYKKFISQRMGLGYVEVTSEKYVQPSTSNSRNPKTTCSEETQAAYVDQQIVQLYNKI